MRELSRATWFDDDRPVTIARAPGRLDVMGGIADYTGSLVLEATLDCGLCVDECPVRAIFPEEDLPAEWQNYVEINTAYFADK